MIPQKLMTVLESHPDRVSGAICFRGTRVPAEIFLDWISGGESLERFLANYPSVQREQALTVLHWMNQQSRDSIGIMSAH